MDFDLIIKNISRHIELSMEEEQYFISILQPKKVKKKQFLLHENQVCTSSIFVVSGCLRAYTIDDNGFEHILQFAPSEWWVADMYSLITQKAGNLNIDALEDSEVLLLPQIAQEKLFVEIPKFERFFRIITENSLVANRQRVIDGLSLSAQQRYANFCKIYPTIIHTIPQKQVAAYIGVTPEFLSKLRGDFHKSK